MSAVELEPVLGKDRLEREDLIALLKVTDAEAAERIRERAYVVKSEQVGTRVFFRGIIEFSNLCIKNCHYCGIRRDNRQVNRFQMSVEEILTSAMWAHENRYGSVVLQSGERQDERFVEFVETVIREIRSRSNNKLGLTLSLGEQSEETYRRWFEAGAHRYLLRIETSNPALYGKLHPTDHSFEKRVKCLRDLRKVGYQVGTGVMIGLPGQTVEDLADDLLFFRDNDIDMIGMGPYVIHKDTPMGPDAPNSEADRKRRLQLGLRMISVARLLLKDVNIAATTALQALHPQGREMGLRAGANIIMPIITDKTYRKDYLLYDGKPCVEDSAGHCKLCLEARIKHAGETIGYGEWGDSSHFRKRRNTP